MVKEEITSRIEALLQDGCGFDVYIAGREAGWSIKNFVLEEGDPQKDGGFKRRIRSSIAETIRNKFLSEESRYAEAGALADEQVKFYVIPQSPEYRPFAYLGTPEEKIPNFKMEDKEEADAVLFKFTRYVDGKLEALWAYQRIQPFSIPNRRRDHFQLRAKSSERTDVFQEMTDQMFMITRAVNLLVLGDEIITDDIGLMERHFKLTEFVRRSAEQAAGKIEATRLVQNPDKLRDYVQRPNKRYAKKMMSIHKYPIVGMERGALLDSIAAVDRWKDVFDVQNGQINLRNYQDVERLIDLFTERFTKSEVSGQEYDTSVKEKAPSIGGA